jgi:hypothetical protein
VTVQRCFKCFWEDLSTYLFWKMWMRIRNPTWKLGQGSKVDNDQDEKIQEDGAGSTRNLTKNHSQVSSIRPKWFGGAECILSLKQEHETPVWALGADVPWRWFQSAIISFEGFFLAFHVYSWFHMIENLCWPIGDRFSSVNNITASGLTSWS